MLKFWGLRVEMTTARYPFTKNPRTQFVDEIPVHDTAGLARASWIRTNPFVICCTSRHDLLNPNMSMPSYLIGGLANAHLDTKHSGLGKVLSSTNELQFWCDVLGTCCKAPISRAVEVRVHLHNL